MSQCQTTLHHLIRITAAVEQIHIPDQPTDVQVSTGLKHDLEANQSSAVYTITVTGQMYRLNAQIHRHFSLTS